MKPTNPQLKLLRLLVRGCHLVRHAYCWDIIRDGRVHYDLFSPLGNTVKALKNRGWIIQDGTVARISSEGRAVLEKYSNQVSPC